MRRFRSTLLAALAVGAATLVGFPLYEWMAPTNLVMLYLATVTAIAYGLGRAPSLLASLLSVLAFDFFFIPPRFTLVAHPEYWLTFVGMFLVALLVSGLTARAREQALEAQARRQETEALFELSKTLGRTTLPAQIEEVVQAHLQARFPGDPDHSYAKAVSVLAEMALERSRLAEEVRQSELLKATERLQRSLLNSVSHDLRIPLVSITGALSVLCESQEGERRVMVTNAYHEAQRLNRLVGNLLQMTRIEAGALQVNRQSTDVADLLGTTLETAGPILTEHKAELHTSSDLPLVEMDYVLMQNVLLNLLENAAKFAPPGTTVDLSAFTVDHELEIQVADRGVGIPEEQLDKVFQRFVRLGTMGTGLGLSICQGLVEAHGGRIWAENRPGGGSLFRIRLPL